jgi:hypothetical protein
MGMPGKKFMKLNSQSKNLNKSRTAIVKILNILFCSYIFFALVDYIQFGNNERTRLFYLLPSLSGLLIFIIQVFYFNLNIFRNKFIVRMTIILLLGITLSMFFLKFNIFPIFIVFSNIIIALFLLDFPLLVFSQIFTYILFGCLSGYFGYSFYIGIPPSEVFSHASWNNISLILIIYAAITYIISDKMDSPVPVLPALSTFLLSFMSYGRSGIISSLILLVGVFWLRFKGERIKVRVYILSFILVSTSLIVLFGNFDVVSLISNLVSNNNYLAKFEVYGLTSESRLEMIYTYLNQLNLEKFFLGDIAEFDDSIIYYDGNYHNSFIRFHSNFGFLSLIFILFMLLATVRLIKQKNLLLLLVLVVVSMRISTDNILFYSNFDFIVYYVVFCAFYNVPRKPGETGFLVGDVMEFSHRQEFKC